MKVPSPLVLLRCVALLSHSQISAAERSDGRQAQKHGPSPGRTSGQVEKSWLELGLQDVQLNFAILAAGRDEAQAWPQSKAWYSQLDSA